MPEIGVCDVELNARRALTVFILGDVMPSWCLAMCCIFHGETSARVSQEKILHFSGYMLIFPLKQQCPCQLERGTNFSLLEEIVLILDLVF
jgi:hypothetical protein